MNALTKKQLIIVATAGSIALLAGAFIFQTLGYPPCKLCFWQRYPHAVAIIAGACALLVWTRPAIFVGLCATLTTGAVGVYHAGVEQKWWAGPSSCSGGGRGLDGLSGTDLLSTDVVDKLVMCDEISWAFAGLSMPAWNAVFSFFLALIWLFAWQRPE